MMYNYNIHSFQFDAETRTFTAWEDQLYPLDAQSSIPFPNAGKQFNIKNPDTGGFRRFRLHTDGHKRWEFLSEEGFKCVVMRATPNPVDSQYLKLLREIADSGVEKEDRTGVGTLSLFGRQFRHRMSEGFPLLTTKRMYWKGIVMELLWFLRGETNIRFLVENDCHIWNGDAYKRFTYYTDEGASMERFVELIKTDEEFAKKWGDLGPIYGKQWRRWESEVVQYSGLKYEREPIDQIANLINELRTNPDSRRLMVNAWNVGELDQMVLPPCHYGFQVYTRKMSHGERCQYWAAKWKKDISYTKSLDEEQLTQLGCPERKISLMWNQRSVDTLLGLPFNIASYGLLLSILGEMVNMVPDELIGNLGDVHLYKNHLEAVSVQLGRRQHSLPKLQINTEFWLTESGSCGEGPLTRETTSLINTMWEEDFQLEDYVCEPTIKAELNN